MSSDARMDELEALEAIYGTDYHLLTTTQQHDLISFTTTYPHVITTTLPTPVNNTLWLAIHITPTTTTSTSTTNMSQLITTLSDTIPTHLNHTLISILPPSYPATNPPICHIVTTYSYDTTLSCNDLWTHDSCIYQMCEWWREIMNAWDTKQEETEKNHEITLYEDETEEESKEMQQAITASLQSQTTKFDIISGPPLTDRKSTFQAHYITIASLNDMHQVYQQLRQLNSKMARATHHIAAWRVLVNGHIHHDHEDDGETGAGSRLQHLMSVMSCNNTLLVVTRWYGGIHLGADRFKHINSVARDLIEQVQGKDKDKDKTKGKGKGK